MYLFQLFELCAAQVAGTVVLVDDRLEKTLLPFVQSVGFLTTLVKDFLDTVLVDCHLKTPALPHFFQFASGRTYDAPWPYQALYLFPVRRFHRQLVAVGVSWPMGVFLLE